MENGEKSKMRIVHIRDVSNNKEKQDLGYEDIDFSKPQSITPEFLAKVTLGDPALENEKRKILNMIFKETNKEIKKTLLKTLVEYIQKGYSE